MDTAVPNCLAFLHACLKPKLPFEQTPLLEEHTDEILRDLHLSTEKIKHLWTNR